MRPKTCNRPSPTPAARPLPASHMQQPVAGGYGVGNDATATVTFERMEVESAAGEVHFHYSVDLPAGDAAAGAPGHVELFSTRLDLVLLPRPLTPGEHMTLLCLGANHGAYVFLPFAKVARRYVVRAGHLPPSAVAFMQQLWEGALSEFYYLCDMDVRGAFTIECDAAPDELPPPVLPAAAAADHDERGGADRGGITSEDGRAGAHSTSPGATAGGQEGGREGPGEPGTTGHPAPRPRVLVPFGGGKDSTLLMQLVHDCGCDVAWCYYGEWAGSWAGYSKFQRLLEASPSQRIFIGGWVGGWMGGGAGCGMARVASGAWRARRGLAWRAMHGRHGNNTEGRGGSCTWL